MQKPFHFFIVAVILVVVLFFLSYNINNEKKEYKNCADELKKCNEDYASVLDDFNYLQNQQKPVCDNITKNIFKETSFEEYNQILSKYKDYDLNNSFEKYLLLKRPYNFDDRLKQIASSLKDDSVQQTIDNIIKWVHKNITYINDTFDKSKYHFNSAIKTFEMGEGVCDDMNDLAISLLRLNGIPSREVDGNMYQRAYVARHSWIEVLYPYENWLVWKPFDVLNLENDAGSYFKYYESE